jgi:hypothetical protein
MTVSISGTNGLIFNDASSQNTAATGFGFKNRLINGSMVIDQRNAGASVTPTAGTVVYTVDRWLAFQNQSSRFSVQQNAGSVANGGSVVAPEGFTNWLGVTSLAATTPASGDINVLAQRIEGFNTADLGFGTASASSVTLSFWVRSSLTGTFGASIKNSAGNRSYPFSFVINSANTWEQKSITIAGDTTGTWLTNNGIGLVITFDLGSGSTYKGTANSWAASDLFAPTGSTNVVGTNGATFYITGVQLEKGSTATSFDYRPYTTELALCQRYYQKTSVAAGYKYITSLGSGVNGTLARANYQLKTSLRDAPTAVDYSNIAVDDNVAVTAITSVTIFSASADSVGLNLVAASGLTQYRPYFGTSNASAGYIGISAEL